MNPPFFMEGIVVFVIRESVVPELHIRQGFVKHLFCVGLVNFIGDDKALEGPTSLNIM